MEVQEALNVTDFLPATLTAPELTEAEFLAFCHKFPDYRVEYSAEGTLIIMAPADLETGIRSSLIVHRLMQWAEKQGPGSVVGPDAGFYFRDGSRRSPDAAWFNEERWQKTRKPESRYPVFAPEFVIELRSPEDRLRLLQEKMEEYIDNGVQLAWLIDPQGRTVTIYRPSRSPELLSNPATVQGEGPVDGFTLSLDKIL
jgi:Uma2 family endonuclease